MAVSKVSRSFARLLQVLTVVSFQTGQAQTSRFDELANLPFEENRPTTQTAQTLRDELLCQRAPPGVPVNMLPISDGTAFDQLKALIDTEPTTIASRYMISRRSYA